jgi:hypothetical protein
LGLANNQIGPTAAACQFALAGDLESLDLTATPRR